MPSHRQVRLGDQLQEEVSQIIRHELKDPRLGFVSVTQVVVAPDLQQATVFTSVMGDEAQQEESLAALESAAGFIRSQLGKALRLRRIPQLTFRLDRSLQHGAHIHALLERVKREEGGPGPERDGSS